MTELPVPFQFLAAWIGMWIARHQERTIAYLKEENALLVEKLGWRIRLTDQERRRLGKLGHELGRKRLREIASIAAPIRSFAGIASWWRRSTTPASDAGQGGRGKLQRSRGCSSEWRPRILGGVHASSGGAQQPRVQDR